MKKYQTSLWSKLDYTALHRQPTTAEVRTFREHAPYSIGLKIVSTILPLVVILPSLLIINFIGFLVLRTDDIQPRIIFDSAALAVAIIVYLKLRHMMEIRRIKTWLFCTANNLQPQRDKRADDRYNGMVFVDANRESMLKDHMTFSPKVTAGNFVRVTGSGRGRNEQTWGFICFTLPRHLPHMVLDATSNNSLLGSNLTANAGYKKSQRLRLEGDFSKHFALYAPDQYKRDALYIFTPDVMVKMIDNGWKYDVEIIGNQVYFYRKGGFRYDREQTYHDFAGLHDIVEDEIVKQAKNYADERIGNRRIDAIAAPGKQLVVKTQWVVIVFGILLFAYWICSIVYTFIDWIIRAVS